MSGAIGGHHRDSKNVIPKTEIQLSVSASNILDADIFSKSDPICILYTKAFGQQSFVEFGRTEHIMNTLNPKFVTKFVLEFYFEEKQELRFELYDVDDFNVDDLSKQDPLGYMECTLGHIVSSILVEKPLLPIKKEKAKGTIQVHVEELSAAKEDMTMIFTGKHIKKKNSFLRIARMTDEEIWKLVYQTKPSKESPNVKWETITISVRTLCNGDYDRELQLSCWEYKSNGSHKLLGEAYTNARKLRRKKGFHNDYKLRLPKMKKGKETSKEVESTISLDSISSKVHACFADFILAGTQIQVTVAIDFTSSNGDPNDPSSLHYNTGRKQSDYAAAIKAVVSILEDYDSDKKIPAIGFGAKCSKEAGCSDMFALNDNAEDMECLGTEGVLQAYGDALRRVKLFGPTNFSKIINHVANQAADNVTGLQYHILLILTDGSISDMPATKQAIVEASVLPLSIIIVGIGKEDFDAMNVLDGDNQRLSHDRRVADRDIVQFVVYRDYQTADNNNHSQILLSKAVLEEVPGQVTSFMKSRKIKPQKISKKKYAATKTTLMMTESSNSRL